MTNGLDTRQPPRGYNQADHFDAHVDVVNHNTGTITPTRLTEMPPPPRLEEMQLAPALVSDGDIAAMLSAIEGFTKVVQDYSTQANSRIATLEVENKNLRLLLERLQAGKDTTFGQIAKDVLWRLTSRKLWTFLTVAAPAIAGLVYARNEVEFAAALTALATVGGTYIWREGRVDEAQAKANAIPPVVPVAQPATTVVQVQPPSN